MIECYPRLVPTLEIFHFGRVVGFEAGVAPRFLGNIDGMIDPLSLECQSLDLLRSHGFDKFVGP